MPRPHRAVVAASITAADDHSAHVTRKETATSRGLFPSGIRLVDLFCGIGGFRFAAEAAAKRVGLKTRCLFSSDIDEQCRQAYAANFGESPSGDITQIAAESIPDHDLLLAGFPCQPFSIIGKMRGFEDTRGTLFFDIARTLAAKHENFRL